MKQKNNSLKAFSVLEISMVLLVVGIITLMVVDGKSIITRARCVVRTFGSEKVSKNIDNLKELNRDKTSDYESCIIDASPLGTCSGLSCTSCKTLLSANSQNTSGTYTIDPDGTGSIAEFDVYCDMTTDGGGWTKILHYKDAAYTPSSAAVNPANISTEYDANISGFAKLSDAQINAIGGIGVTKTYRISGNKTTKKYYTKSNGIWNDLARAYGLPNASRQVCENDNISGCPSKWIITAAPYIDTMTDTGSNNDCSRYFTDYENTPQCIIDSIIFDNNKRCFSSGSACNHSIINNLEIYLRE